MINTVTYANEWNKPLDNNIITSAPYDGVLRPQARAKPGPYSSNASSLMENKTEIKFIATSATSLKSALFREWTASATLLWSAYKVGFLLNT
jgi:hypothetical protein